MNPDWNGVGVGCRDDGGRNWRVSDTWEVIG